MALARGLTAQPHGILTARKSRFKSPVMINDATTFNARRRRISAVRAVICV
jgi:hypothetical protein